LAENQLTEIEEARAFAQAIIDTVREPILVLDQDLRVITASRSFYRTFRVGPEDTEGRLLYQLADGHWNIPKLRLLLEKIVPEHGVMEDYEVEYDFRNVGLRTMCLNARKVFYEKDGVFAQPKSGLGTGIVTALAQQLGAKVETLVGPGGTTVSVTYATFSAKTPRVV
jgi:PAS domain-containing protein